jgi:hypothetical protein
MPRRPDPKNETSLALQITGRGYKITHACRALSSYFKGEITPMALYNQISGNSALTKEKLRELIHGLNEVLDTEQEPITSRDIIVEPETFRII